MSTAPKIAKSIGRSVKEWIGKTADTWPPPEAVQLRIFRRQHGKCHISGKKIRPGDEKHLDHVIPLERGGKNRESNIAWALGPDHRAKTAIENSENAKADRNAARHVGIVKKATRKQIKSAPFPTTEKPERSDRKASIDKSALLPLGASNIARRFGPK